MTKLKMYLLIYLLTLDVRTSWTVHVALDKGRMLDGDLVHSREMHTRRVILAAV
jgi:hypothetical protein